jgi:preprotein translocase subunit SecA
MITDMRAEVVAKIVSSAIPENSYSEQWDIPGLHAEVLRIFGLDLPIADWAKEEGIAEREVEERILKAAEDEMAAKEAAVGADSLRFFEKQVLLQTLDRDWKDHLLTLDHLRQGINLRSYAQRDPLREYQSEAFNLFEEMLAHMREHVTSMRAHARAPRPEEMAPRPAPAVPPGAGFAAVPPAAPAAARVAGGVAAGAAAAALALHPEWAQTPRNAPCPCGSGKKFKHCHGAVA